MRKKLNKGEQEKVTKFENNFKFLIEKMVRKLQGKDKETKMAHKRRRRQLKQVGTFVMQLNTKVAH